MTLTDIARRLNRRHPQLPCLWLMSDSVRLADPVAALASLYPGEGVIFRHYDAPDREALAARLARECRRRRLKLLIAGDRALALRVGADGMHWPEYQLRRLPGPPQRPVPWWIDTAAVHSPAALFRAARCGMDAALLSPVFTTASHAGARGLGPIRFARFTIDLTLPVYALGGVTAATAPRLFGSRAVGLAGIDGICTRKPRDRAIDR